MKMSEFKEPKQDLNWLISIHDEKTGELVDTKYLSADDGVHSSADAIKYWEKNLKKPGLRANISDVKMSR
ncbi:hypothetical protein LCGC14_1309310 [marine sediment metagenome]|uniref:Uncharacterized protein n=1 Tax=marine sediment metagenome TaxID=412755 RepID=A0A0F9L7S1_9ZZZZ